MLVFHSSRQSFIKRYIALGFTARGPREPYVARRVLVPLFESVSPDIYSH